MGPHTAAKHTILRKYLDAWLPIMSAGESLRAVNGRGRLLLVDGFCGPGRYAGGEDGSPLLMLKAFLEHGYRDRIRTELVYVFIDQDKDRLQHLEHVELPALQAAQPGGMFPDQVKINILHGAFEDVFTSALDELEENGRRPAPTFAFIDPFGYKDASMQLTGRLLRFSRCEALIYMPLPFVHRFVGMPEQAAVMDRLFGTERWRDAIPMQGEQRRRFLHDLFLAQLAGEPGDRLVRSFDVPTAKGMGYHLFFTTGHEKGMEVMKDAMWTVDPLEGQRFEDSTDSDQLVIFSPDVNTSPLLADLRRHFGTAEFSIEQAKSFTIRETAFRSAHLKTKTLKPAEKAGELLATTARSKRFTYPDGTRMRFVS
jgi:three-Cys-motif partner protein